MLPYVLVINLGDAARTAAKVVVTPSRDNSVVPVMVEPALMRHLAPKEQDMPTKLLVPSRMPSNMKFEPPPSNWMAFDALQFDTSSAPVLNKCMSTPPGPFEA